jgi:hypothetical protein
VVWKKWPASVERDIVMIVWWRKLSEGTIVGSNAADAR